MNSKISSRSALSVKILCTCLLVGALFPIDSYGYYTLLRWICCSGFAFITLGYFQVGIINWVWIFGTSVGVYNPLVPLALNKELWSIVNVITIAILAVSVIKDYQRKSLPKNLLGYDDLLKGNKDKYEYYGTAPTNFGEFHMSVKLYKKKRPSVREIIETLLR